jgi:hypothetical protein
LSASAIARPMSLARPAVRRVEALPRNRDATRAADGRPLALSCGAGFDRVEMPTVVGHFAYQLPDVPPLQPVVALVQVRAMTPDLFVILNVSLVVGDSVSTSYPAPLSISVAFLR